MQDFRNLKVWRSSRCLTYQVFRASENLPNEQAFAQLRNSCVMILANIARAYDQENPKQFLPISLDSINLLEHRLNLARKHCWISEIEYAALSQNAAEISQMLKRILHA